MSAGIHIPTDAEWKAREAERADAIAIADLAAQRWIDDGSYVTGELDQHLAAWAVTRGLVEVDASDIARDTADAQISDPQWVVDV